VVEESGVVSCKLPPFNTFLGYKALNKVSKMSASVSEMVAVRSKVSTSVHSDESQPPEKQPTPMRQLFGDFSKYKLGKIVAARQGKMKLLAGSGGLARVSACPMASGPP
jgi:hypothetical protein